MRRRRIDLSFYPLLFFLAHYVKSSNLCPKNRLQHNQLWIFDGSKIQLAWICRKQVILKITIFLTTWIFEQKWTSGTEWIVRPLSCKYSQKCCAEFLDKALHNRHMWNVVCIIQALREEKLGKDIPFFTTSKMGFSFFLRFLRKSW